jgi:hypothetical protein
MCDADRPLRPAPARCPVSTYQQQQQQNKKVKKDSLSTARSNQAKYYCSTIKYSSHARTTRTLLLYVPAAIHLFAFASSLSTEFVCFQKERPFISLQLLQDILLFNVLA